MDLQGILLPVVTPFTSDGSIGYEDLRHNLQAWNKTGIRGHVLLGSTGERVHLDDKEYLQTIEAARAVVPDDLLFIAGAGQQSIIGTIKEVNNAARAGADAVLVITPYFYRIAITQETLVSYYTAVADEAPLPVLLYSMPPLTGIKIEPETVAQLSEHPNIIGVKDSSNDVAGFRRTVELCPKDFAVMTGNGTVLLDALHAGATGGILAVGCVVPEVCVEIFRAFKAGEEEYAAMLQSKLTLLATAVPTKYGIGGLKAALDMAGYRGGNVRAPLRAPDESARAEIATLLDRMPRFSRSASDL
ncbi:MAG TPA: dihydrodipicolinate synthase family protein [Pyrinomonadaceae bacterium]